MPDPRLRVLFVSKWLDVGGAERFVSTALQHLDPERFDLRLCLFRRIVGYPIPKQVPVTVLSPAPEHRHWHVAPMVWRLARAIDRERPDVVVSAYAYPSFVVGSALRLARHRPRWLARVASNPLHEEAGLRRPLLRWAYRRADRFVANAERLGACFAEVHPFARGRVHHLPNPTDFARLDALAQEPVAGSEPERPTLVSVGRLAPQKRLDVLLDALARLRTDVDAELQLCGDGPLRPALERRAADLGIADAVRFLGFQRNPFPRMARADLFVLTSDHEGSPNALIEAQGLGVPAVATDCDFGPCEIVEPGRTGWLVPTGDAAELAAALREALRDPERLRRMREAARARTRARFAADRVCALLAEHIEAVARS